MTAPVIRRERLADQVYDLLRQRILSQELPPDAHLSVPSIAAELDLSRSPVREAVQRLVVEGLVEEEFHRGARVAGVSAEELEEIYAVRAVLEALAAACAARRVDDDLLTALRAALGAHQDALAAGDQPAILAADLAFHLAVVAGAGNRHLARALEPMLGRSQVAMAAGDLTTWPKQAVTEHRAILEAIEAGDARAAERAARAHVRAVLARHRERPR